MIQRRVSTGHPACDRQAVCALSFGKNFCWPGILRGPRGGHLGGFPQPAARHAHTPLRPFRKKDPGGSQPLFTQRKAPSSNCLTLILAFTPVDAANAVAALGA